MQFTQTGFLGQFSDGLGKTLRDHYGGVLSEGFLKSDIPEHIADFYGTIFVDHERYNDRVRILAPNDATLDILIAQKEERLDPWSQWLHDKLDATRSEPEAILTQLSTDVPGMDRVITNWVNTNLESLELTSLGIVIAHANWKGMGTGNALSLDVYLPDDDAVASLRDASARHSAHRPAAPPARSR